MKAALAYEIGIIAGIALVLLGRSHEGDSSEIFMLRIPQP
jgi:hypothetical protein